MLQLQSAFGVLALLALAWALGETAARSRCGKWLLALWSRS